VRPYEAVAAVVDPEIRSITIAELGMLRGVAHDRISGQVTVTITPTYSGCPAMDLIRSDITRALNLAGYREVSVETVLTPAWSTAMITESGRAKLAAAGIAPPAGGVLPPPAGLPTAPGEARAPVPVRLSVRCPRCGSPDTEELSHFGSTACKALWRCRSCAEPFEQVKTL
jgi:ring-1,2-phenylacetyl-CoA epoxidase subunit PaaD